MGELIQCVFCPDRELSFGFMFLKLYFSPLPQKKQMLMLHLNHSIVDLFIGRQMNS